MAERAKPIYFVMINLLKQPIKLAMTGLNHNFPYCYDGAFSLHKTQALLFYSGNKTSKFHGATCAVVMDKNNKESYS
jgi:hypothetical protein